MKRTVKKIYVRKHGNGFRGFKFEDIGGGMMAIQYIDTDNKVCESGMVGYKMGLSIALVVSRAFSDRITEEEWDSKWSSS